jgi:hypothetical protein
MEGASSPERSVAKTTKSSCKFQADILNRLGANWRALVRPYLTPIHGAETPAEGRTRTHGSVETLGDDHRLDPRRCDDALLIRPFLQPVSEVSDRQFITEP